MLRKRNRTKRKSNLIYINSSSLSHAKFYYLKFFIFKLGIFYRFTVNCIYVLFFYFMKLILFYHCRIKDVAAVTMKGSNITCLVCKCACVCCCCWLYV